METFPLRLESRTIALLDPTDEDGESALNLLESTDHHVSLVVLLHGTASQALHEFAGSAEILREAAEIYLDQVAQRIDRDDRFIERVIAQGPDPMRELQDLAATRNVAKVLVPAASKPLDGWLFNMRVESGSDGHLRVERNSEVVAELDAGAIAGEMALMTGKPCNADVVATESSAVLALTKSDLDAVLDSCPEMAHRVYKTAVLRMGAIA